MGRDTIQLEDAVSTISGEYLLIRYSIELAPRVAWPRGYHCGFSGGQSAAKVGHFEITCRALNIIPTLNVFRVFYIPSYNSGWMSFSKRLGNLLKNWNNRFLWVDEKVFPTVVDPLEHPLDFANEDLSRPNIEGVGTEEQIKDELSWEIRPVGHMRHKRANDEAEANAPPKVLKKDHMLSPTHSTYGGKSLAIIGLGAVSISSTPSTQGAPTAPKSVSDPDPLSYMKPQPYLEQDIAQSSRGTATEIPTEHVATTEVNVQLSMGIPESGKLTFDACQDTVDHIALSRYFSESCHLPNAYFLSQYNMNLARQVAIGSQLRLRFEQEAKNAELTKELESLRVRFLDLQVNNNQLSQQVSNIQAQITGVEKIKATFEEFKKYEDDRVEQRCAKMDARLDKLSMYFNEELYPHMLTAIAGHCWVIGHGLCMSEGLEHGIEHGKAGRYLEAVEAYDPEAHNRYLKALQELKDLKYLLVDQMEGLKDAPMELIMASLHLESDSEEDTP
ncbi:hypothetical protein Tco_1179355, partial [Tanacetum coccineum]